MFNSLKISFKRSWFTHGSLLLILSLFDYHVLNAQREILKYVACPGTPTVKDFDGNEYNTVQIGTQCWTKENLRVTKYRDGTIIPLDESGEIIGDATGQTWSSRTTGARTVYGHDAANLVAYGYLYNWYAVADSKGLCPKGWHVPSDSEWTTLENYLKSVVPLGNVGGKMKSTGTTYWNSPNTEATNASGFSALPGGCRHGDDCDGCDGFFFHIRDNAFFWSASESVSNFAWNRDLNYNYGNVFRPNFSKQSGFSVRCLRD